MPLPRWIRRASVIAAGVVLLLLVTYGVACKLFDPRLEPTPERLEKSMAMAVDFLEAHTLESGRFIYEVDGKGEPSGKKYNVLRHAGTIYSLTQYHAIAPSPELRELILRASRYLVERHVSPVRDLPGRSTIFSLPGEEEGRERSAKLGAAGLGLIALTSARALDESVVTVEVLREMGEFILFMQQPDGSFRSKYSETSQFADDFDSLYYPGEAIFGLTMLHELDRDPRWLEAALRAVRSLIDRQRAMDEPPPDHWLMIATGKLATVYDQAVAPPVTLDEMLEHAITIGIGMIAIQEWVALLPGFSGAFGGDGRSTPSATRLEGLIAIHRVLPADHPVRPTLAESIHSGVSFLLACQETDGPNVGGFREALRRLGGGRNWRHVRIDYVQHALSALIGCGESVCR